MSRSEEFAGQLGHPNLTNYFGSDLGFVHRDDLKKLRGNDLRYDTADLSKSIESEGVREPLHVEYNPQSGVARLGEGNHRLNAAMATSRQFLPVVVHRANGLREGTPVSEQPGFPREDRPQVPKDQQYVKGQFHPRYLFEGAK